MNRPLIYIASPYGAKSAEGIQENIDFVKAAGRAAIEAGYTPVIVHLVYPVLLRDDVPEERALGISMDFQLLEKCDAMVYYTHKGVSSGMDLEIRHALEHGIPTYRLADIGKDPLRIIGLAAYEDLLAADKAGDADRKLGGEPDGAPGGKETIDDG